MAVTNTKELFRETFKYLQPDGRVNMVEDIVAAGENSNDPHIQPGMVKRIVQRHSAFNTQ
jgi:hypothetical protein